MAAGLPPAMPPPQQKPYDPSRDALEPPTNRSRPQMPPALATTRSGPGPIGVAISRPTQVPQWPLAATIEGPDSRSNQQYQPPAGRSVAPQRPPRPSHVPSMLDASRLQEHTPSFQYQPQLYPPERAQGTGMRAEEEDTASPILTSPMTQSSRPSTISSVGTIPDFPIPAPPPIQSRRSANLGPPPTSRRGASSYYSQASFVSPIPEESPRTQASHGSYASSAAIPSSWGSDSPGYQYDYDEDDDEDDITERGYGADVIEEGHESRESHVDDNEDRGLIRSASVGKRAKPSMITTKSSDKVEPVRPAPVPQQMQASKLQNSGAVDGNIGGALAGKALGAPRADDTQRDTRWPIVGNGSSPLAGGTGLIESSSSENSFPTMAKAVATEQPVIAGSPSDARASEILGAYHAASSFQPSVPAQTRAPSPGFSRLSAIRRPPRLDMDAVRDAEARGSLTSLPDLIRRATRLAAMMDRGKRPGSRLNDLNDFPMSGDEKDAELLCKCLFLFCCTAANEIASNGDKRRSGLSGMLAAFPPPGVATPRDGTPRPISSWPSPYNASDGPLDPNNTQREKKRRRVCGLPCWAFLLVIGILLIIVAAAIVVPLEFLVINKPKTKAAASSPVQQCEGNSTTACQNGGSSLIDNESCACICTNGFTGSTCSIAGSAGCTTTTLSGSSLRNITLGDSISRLISASQTNFSIPLSANTILARFNSANLSCTSENALVTFDGESQRVNQANDVVTPASTETVSAIPSSVKKPRDDYYSYTTSATSAPSSTNGIIYDSAATPSPTATASSASSSGEATSSSSTASPTAHFTITEEVLDFARVAVLFVLQQEQLDSAVSAQSALQKFFAPDSFNNNAAMNISLGNGNSINLVSFSVEVGNGTVGAKSSSSSRRHLHGRRARLWTS